MDRESLMILEDERGVDRFTPSVEATDLFDLGGIVRRVRDGEGASIESLAREVVYNLDDDILDQFVNRMSKFISQKRYGI